MRVITGIIKNKYYLTGIVFVIWMGLIDKYDLIGQFQLDKKIEQLTRDKAYFVKETTRVTQELLDLTHDRNKLEKFAREKYLMKKDNEVLYVIVHQKKRMTYKDSLLNKIRSIF